ncbi:excinuclease ABC subunit UvrC [Thermosyntropha sp.]|uniref:excinuclease ABC subunit UvrC n=1 Tax=Thermosyntropha sp. TaxID=2740820 RepID=UPI0025CE0F41|nr:excinuclease ABC subunit UvrC [Thermosyntropha sp.]MBO8159012.1 excinuclease ABC subunit UvrC [Thermosyntropha sp.]
METEREKEDNLILLKSRLKEVPLKPGVYIYKDETGRVIYVGKAKRLRDRMRSYFQSPDNLHPKVKAMMRKVADFDFIVTGSEVEALILENNLIKEYKPKYNINLRDDKTYPYLKLTLGEEFPRLYITREEKDRISRYFGPYPDVGSLRETLRVLRQIFPLRSCRGFKGVKRPCLNRDIGKCLAPCTGEVSAEEYGKVVQEFIRFMEGEDEEIIKRKEEEMKEAALNLEFEKAAAIRDTIANIRKIQDKQQVSLRMEHNFDLIVLQAGGKESLVLLFRIRKGKVVGKDSFWLLRPLYEDEAGEMQFFISSYYEKGQDIPPEIIVNILPSEPELLEAGLKEKTGHKVKIKVPVRGDKKNLLDMALENARLLYRERYDEENKKEKALIRLSRVLNMETVPLRIEGYDISHLAGTDTVASMVVFTEGGPDKKSYRRFKMEEDQNDDFASLVQTLRRRFEASRNGNPAFLPEPDLILIDGGLGQVNAVKEVLEEMDVDIPLCSLAKKREEIYLPGMSTPIVLPRGDEALRLLQRIRDEAHRFAITYNRNRRVKKMKTSVLDDIEGVGEKRKQVLLKNFGSVEMIKKASVEELASLPGMNRKIAQKIKDYFSE